MTKRQTSDYAQLPFDEKVRCRKFAVEVIRRALDGATDHWPNWPQVVGDLMLAIELAKQLETLSRIDERDGTPPRL